MTTMGYTGMVVVKVHTFADCIASPSAAVAAVLIRAVYLVPQVSGGDVWVKVAVFVPSTYATVPATGVSPHRRCCSCWRR